MSRAVLSRRSFAALPILAACAREAMTGTVAPVSGDPRVGQYVSSGWTFATSSFWIRGPSGVVLVDTQFLPSAGVEALTLAERATRAHVTTAKPPGATYLDRLRSEIEKATSKRVILTSSVDPSLIGGVVTTIGDRVVDGSLRSQLQKFRDGARPTV